MKIIEFGDCIDLKYSNIGRLKKNYSAYEWLINQDHIPFDISSDAQGMYWMFYTEFLKDLYKLYCETGDEYYWYSNGKLLSDSEMTEKHKFISENSIMIDKSKVREFKLNQLLNIY